MANKQTKKETTVEAPARRAFPRIVPLLSGRSIISLFLGVILGAGLGMVYWVASPAFSSQGTDGDSAGLESAFMGAHDGPWGSSVLVQVVNPGSEALTLRQLETRGEYYAAKASTYPFLRFLGDELAAQAPEYYHPVDELASIVNIEYDRTSVQPAIRIDVAADTSEETIFLVAFIPPVFQSYLLDEERNTRASDYEQVAADIVSLREMLLDAEEDLSVLEIESIDRDLGGDAQYVALVAKSAALSVQMANQASALAALIISGDQSSAYFETQAAFERASVALAEASKDIALLETQLGAVNVVQDLEYRLAQERVDDLASRLSASTRAATSLLSGTNGGSDALDYLAVGNASPLVPILPERIRMRDAIVLGTMIGVVGAWAMLNRRWLAGSLRADDDALEGDDEEAAA